MKLKKLFGCLLLVTTLGTTTSCGDVFGCGGDLSTIIASKKLVVGFEAGYKPFEYKNSANGQFQGFDIEVSKLIVEEINSTDNSNVDVVFKDMNFDGLIGWLQAKQIDLIVSAFSITDTRKESVLFSDSYFESKTVVVTKESNTSITDFDSLKNVKLGAQLGTVQGDIISGEDFSSSNQTLTSISNLILALQSNTLEGLVVEKPVAEQIIKLQSGLKIIDSIDFGDDGAYGIATNYTIGEDLIKIVNSCIKKNTDNGKLNQLYQEAANGSLVSD